MNYIILIIVAIVSFAIGRKTARNARSEGRIFAPRQHKEILEMQEEAREALTERTERRKVKILNLMNGEAVHDEELKACGVEDIKKGIESSFAQAVKARNYLLSKDSPEIFYSNHRGLILNKLLTYSC